MSLLVVGSMAFDAHGNAVRQSGPHAGRRGHLFLALRRAISRRCNLVGIVGNDFTAKEAAVFQGRKHRYRRASSTPTAKDFSGLGVTART